MKKNNLIILALLATNIVQGQSEISETKTIYSSINMGLSIPLSSYSAQDISKSNSGYAGTGLSIDGSIGSKIYKNLNAEILLGGSTHSADFQNLANYFSSQSSTNVSVTSTKWTSFRILMGPNFILPIENKFFLNFKILGGIMISNSPSANFIFQNSTMYLNQLSKESVSSFATLIGLGFRCKINSKFNFVSNINYIQSNISYKQVVLESNSGTQLADYDIIHSTFNPTIGVQSNF
jgi:hypothetical protein